MKIINAIYKILASICMAVCTIFFITAISVAILWLLFDPNREWMIVMPIWARFLFLIYTMGFSSLLVYTDYLRLKKENS